MIVNSHNIEFGYELLSAIPYAHELYLKGELTETISGIGSEPLYYFSPKHTINPEQRSWYNTKKAREEGLPYTVIHKPEQPAKQFPPYKEQYKNDEFKFKKSTLCICNRYNIEWSTKPINFFDETILDWLFSNLKDKYEIIYFPVSLPEELQDDAHSMLLSDIEVANKYGIKLFTDLCKDKNWNETLLKVFANCEHFITMNGGYSILASMFSGTNIIYSKPGKPEAFELKNKSFWRWYPNINNVRTLHVPNYDELKSKIKALYIDEITCLNILIRTFRPNYLRHCMQSIMQQTYKNINVVFICDSKVGIEGTREHNGRLIEVSKDFDKQEKPAGPEYGIFFPFNNYIAQAQKLVNGYILVLDDDDKLTKSDSVEVIMSKASKDSLLIWKVDFNDFGIKPGLNFGKEIVVCDIAGIGFCYHASQIKHTDWTPWKRADYRTAKKLSKVLKIVWIDNILTGIQDVLGMGKKQDLPNIVSTNQYKLIYPNGVKLNQYFTDAELEQAEDTFKRYGICIERMN
jgi:hypothetical protein